MVINKAKNHICASSLSSKPQAHHGHETIKKPSILRRKLRQVPSNLVSQHNYPKKSSAHSVAFDVSADIKADDYSLSKSPRIQFSRSITDVMKIPSRDAYSPEQLDKLWYSCADLQAMIWRNTLEYNWERGDWKAAVEEDSFCYYNGKKVHPAHLPVNYSAAISNEMRRMTFLKGTLVTALSLSTENLGSLLEVASQVTGPS